MPQYSEAICAQITPAGYAAIAVIRISGTEAIAIVAKHFRPSSKLLKSISHRVLHGTFYSESGQAIDEVLLTVFRNPRSYTGEDTVEISCHGNPNLANRILSNLLLHARMAKPGEFTLRAFLNGKLDLSQAEAVNDLIHAQASKAESAALMQVQGVLSTYLQELQQQITDARLRCELAIDFSDQDLPQIDLDALKTQLSGILTMAEELSSKGEQGKRIREGTKICLSGAPNAGKSSLFNAFLQCGRAIVTPHPGTTRDYLEESISLHGFPLVIYDTAGLRESSDEIEQQGIAKSQALMQEADLILFLIDSTQPDRALPSYLTGEQKAKTITVYSKSDLLPENHRADFTSGVYCNATEPDGLNRLTEIILSKLLLSEDILSKPLVTNARHLSALSRCIEALKSAVTALNNEAGFEFVAFELITASHALEEILGVITTDDLLESIFSNFCIGK